MGLRHARTCRILTAVALSAAAGTLASTAAGHAAPSRVPTPTVPGPGASTTSAGTTTVDSTPAGLTTTNATTTTPAGVTTPVPSVALDLPDPRFGAGRTVSATLDDHGAGRITVAQCASLSRLTAAGTWQTITHSHGARVACPVRDPVGATVRPGHSTRITAALWDDLRPGTYRLTLPYRSATGTSTGGSQPPFSAGARPVAVSRFTVTRFAPGPAPHLSEARLRRIALSHAKAAGDATPTLVQHAEGTRFLATLVGDAGEVVDAWNWSYLVVIRGRFIPHFSAPPGIPMGPGPVVMPYKVLTLVVNARSGQVSDTGGANVAPRLSRLGRISTDLG